MDESVRAAYLVGDGVSLRVKSQTVQGRYKILVHYYQPSHGKYNGRIIVQSRRSTALYLRFKHCPNVGGCRALARDKITQMGRSLYIYNKADITISISPNNEVWIDYILFVPSRHFNADMEKQQPVSLAQKFIKQCGKNDFIVDSSSQFCKESVFTMTTMFNGALTTCDCDRNGSTSAVCDKFGGQCPCRQNVVGRKCDKCIGGYTGFPNCRRA
ncbi:Hypothetical predicted protein [Paramuricea clavata]|nr:Hypothetical predicted protein [Paramuricea clavata]